MSGGLGHLPGAGSDGLTLGRGADGVVTQQELSLNFWDCSDPYFELKASMHRTHSGAGGASASASAPHSERAEAPCASTPSHPVPSVNLGFRPARPAPRPDRKAWIYPHLVDPPAGPHARQHTRHAHVLPRVVLPIPPIRLPSPVVEPRANGRCRNLKTRARAAAELTAACTLAHPSSAAAKSTRPASSPTPSIRVPHSTLTISANERERGVGIVADSGSGSLPSYSLENLR